MRTDFDPRPRHGVIDDATLRAGGLGPSGIRHRVRRGRLIRLHPGVYAVGHDALRREGRWLAAVLACRPSAWLSHLDAAAARGWIAARGASIHVTTTNRSGRSALPGVTVHRVGRLAPHEVDVVDEIPITSPARTLLDCAPLLRPRALEQLVLAAVEQGDFHLPDVERALVEHPRRPGRPVLRRVLDGLARRGGPEVRSEAELGLLELCDAHGLPAPATNVPLLGFLVDAWWVGTDLVIEVDSWAFHRGRSSFEADRARDRALALAGYRVVRITARQLQREPRAIADELRALLAGAQVRGRSA